MTFFRGVLIGVPLGLALWVQIFFLLKWVFG